MKKPRPREAPAISYLSHYTVWAARARGVPVAGVSPKPSRRTGKVLGCLGLVQDSSLVAIQVVH